MDLILSEASIIVARQKPPTVALPIKSDQATLDGSECENESGSEREEADSDEELFDGELRNLKGVEDRKVARSKRIYTTSRTICSMQIKL
ncbi:hypothetical protein PGT21_010164 [Puccinia graminis f. sp. tritici]|uniref:Uncharacterized protein n=1 Tax=Puccinia graminis f. sp. tritici TaxID=56615 RepID=A0A5B0M651_PUCGR|nr:hypothetical protein PGT21_010164 [Puccinia graminis f. sp. tritici]